MASSPATSAPVCVTGASGFIASQLVADLLAAGYRVRGTVRDASAAGKYEMLTSLPGAAERLELVSADLLAPDTFRAAVAGCEVVMHTASPYVLDVKDPQRDLVDPAVQGTHAVLEACAAVGGVKRVVLTSSMAAVTDEPDDRVLTEDDWNDKSSLSRNPYYYSKTLAERAAWTFVEQRAPGFDLVVINPFMVIGPSLSPALNQSNKVLSDMLTGGFPGIINIAWGFVDVRDVARAHVLAMEKPEARGRYLCANATLTMRQVVDLLRERGYGDHKLPKLGLDSSFGNAMARFGALFQPKGTRSYIRTHLGRVPKFDNGKIRRELGLQFRALPDTIVDAVEDMIHWGHIPATRRPA